MANQTRLINYTDFKGERFMFRTYILESQREILYNLNSVHKDIIASQQGILEGLDDNEDILQDIQNGQVDNEKILQDILKGQADNGNILQGILRGQVDIKGIQTQIVDRIDNLSEDIRRNGNQISSIERKIDQVKYQVILKIHNFHRQYSL